ncbi:WhiB family transcriptional regulator [Crossiella sp. NPDC003009]
MTTLVALRAPRWHVHAACQNADRQVDWTDAKPGSKAAADCKAICRLCPVRLTCAITALTKDESYGVWAALTKSTAKRSDMLRFRSQHEHSSRLQAANPPPAAT